ncbi:hypothetical protein A7K94_0206170, partial [Modestobacter sp. VKM Ac-2676]
MGTARRVCAPDADGPPAQPALPFYRRTWFLAVAGIVVLLVGIGIGGAGGGTSTSAVAGSAPVTGAARATTTVTA